MSYILTSSQIQDIRWRRQFSRETKARIVPYYYHEGKLYFLLGKEHFNNYPMRGIYNMLGGCRESNETIFKCAERELKEETLGIIPFNWSRFCLIQRNRRYIFFIPFSGQITFVPQEFQRRKKLLEDEDFMTLSYLYGSTIDKFNANCLKEIDELVWISETQIRNNTIYRSVVDVFQNITLNGRSIGLDEFKIELLK